MRSSALFLPLFLSLGTIMHGQFSPEQMLYRTPSANVRTVQSLDINGDGSLDVLIGSGRGVFWYAGDGAGGFGPMSTLEANDLQEHLAAAEDLDGDGDQDVIYGASATGRVHLLVNAGAGQFAPAQLLDAAGPAIVDLAFHDLEQDGDMDLVLSRDNGVHKMNNLGGGAFGDDQIVRFGNMADPTAVFGDLNGDGYPDLVMSTEGANIVRWYPNDGTGNIGVVGTVVGQLENTPRSLAIGDLDADGDQDVLGAIFYEHEVHLYRNDGSGGFGADEEAYVDGVYPYRLIAPDVDGDGDADMVLSSAVGDQLDLLVNNGNGLDWTVHEIDAIPNDCRALTMGDLDGDGDPDLVYGSYGDGQVKCALSNGPGYDAPQPLAIPFGQVWHVYRDDLNGDGHPDVIGCSYQPDAVIVGLSNGPASIGEYYALDSTYLWTSRLALADVDGDGDIDLIRAPWAPQRADIYRNDGTGHFQLTGYVDDEVFDDITAADMDNDGDMDMCFVRAQAVTAGFYRNNGDGTAWTLVNLTTSGLATNLNGVAAHDLDGDGDNDMVVHSSENGVGGRVRWFQNDGAWATFPYPNTLVYTGAFETYISFDFGDVDNDGDLDILYAMDFDAILGWTRNDGTGFFDNEPNLGTYTTYSLRCTRLVDMDGDGDLDAVYLRRLTGGTELAWLPNDGTGAFGPPILVPCFIPGGNWFEPMDFDGDGDQDLLIGAAAGQALYWIENFYGSPYSVSGRVYYDVDGNGTASVEEPGFPYVQLSMEPDGSTPMTTSGGGYMMYCDTGTYVVGHAVNEAFWQLSSDSATYTAHVHDGQPQVTGLDFGFLPDVDSTLATTWCTSAPIACSDTIPMWAGVTNQGSTILQGTLQYTLDSSFTFVSAEPAPSSVVGNVIQWEVDSVFFYDHWVAHLHVGTPDFSQLGDTVYATTTFAAEDEVGTPIGEFTSDQSLIVTCAYDPNTKEVEPRGFGGTGAVDIATSPLTYTIHFQNTGNAPAQRVFVRDQLSPLLDPASLTILGTSHTLTGLSISAGHEVVFDFDGIQLPDSAADEPGSHGFVRFSLRPVEPVVHGTVVENHAEIHFDLNPAVITDTTVTVFIDCSTFTAAITEEVPGLLRASEGLFHQWYLNGLAISGADSSTINPVDVGTYTVRVTSSFGCVAESEPYLVMSINLVDGVLVQALAIHPVPATSTVRLVSNRPMSELDHVEILDIHGRVVRSLRGNRQHELRIDREGMPAGIYLVRLSRAGRQLGTARLVWE